MRYIADNAIIIPINVCFMDVCMRYIGVIEAATKWNISERSVRNYCTNGRIPGAVLDGKTWDIPEDAVKPQRKKRTEKIETD